MAEVLDKEPLWGVRSAGKYPWEQWLDGQIWKLTHGHDFEVAAQTFRNAARSIANARGHGLKTLVTKEGDVVLQAIHDATAAPATPAAPAAPAEEPAAPAASA